MRQGHGRTGSLAAPVRVRFSASVTDLELRIQDGRWRALVQPRATIEVWANGALLGMMSGQSLTRLVAHHLAGAVLAESIRAELAQPEPEAPQPQPVIIEAPRKPPAPVSAEQRATLRARRRRRA